MKTSTHLLKSLLRLVPSLILAISPSLGFMAWGQTAETFQSSETFNVQVNAPRVTVQLLGGDGADGSHIQGSVADNAGGSVPVTFYVDMTGHAYTDVFLAGSFTNWETNQVAMTNVGNNIFSFTTTATFDVGTAIEFKFRNGTGWEPDNNRTYTVVEGTNVYHAVYGVMVPAVIGWANLQHPASGNIAVGSKFDVYARLWVNGISGEQNGAAQIPNLQAWIGYSTENTNPNTWTNWVPAIFNGDADNEYGQKNNEEYGVELGAHITAPGTYYYASRFKLGMANNVYGGYHGGVPYGHFWDGITYISGTLVVEPVYQVTFNVDMSRVTGFDPAATRLDITGTLFTPNWQDPGSAEVLRMTRLDETPIFSKTLSLKAGTYEYKYFYDGNWFNGDWESPSNRKITVTGNTTVDDIFGFINFSGFGNLDDDNSWDVILEEEINPLKINIKGIPDVSSESQFELSSLIISGGYLTIFGSLTVSDYFENLRGVDGLFIEDGGSLIEPDGVVAQLRRNIPFGGWHFISSSVAPAQILGSDFAPNTSPLPASFDFYSFNESVPDNLPWINLRGSDGTPNTTDFSNFVSGKGYLVAYYAGYGTENPFRFAGPVNTGDITIPLSNIGPNAALKGWNLIGNPYPSGLWWNPDQSSGLAQSSAAVYVSQSENPGYVYIENDLLLPNQGFFVLTDNATEFTFMQNMREHPSINVQKSSTLPEALVLRLSNQSNADNTTIRVLEGTVFARDFYDASKMFSFSAHMPQLYSFTSDQVRVAINSVPAISHDSEFTLGLRAPAAGQYTLTLTENSGAFMSHPLFVRDLKTGAVHNLQQSHSFSFQAAQGEDPARFVLTFAQPTNVPTLGESLVNIYTWGNTLYLNFSTEAPGRLMQVYDLSGRVIMSRKLNQGSSHTYQLNAEQGVYVVRVSSPEGVSSQRVFVR